MWPYWLLFIIPAYWTITRLSQNTHPENIAQSNSWPFIWKSMFVFMVLIIGFRHEVGGDWGNYLEHIETVPESLQESLTEGRVDPAYSLLNWLAAKTGLGIYLVNTSCAVLFAWGLVVFCRAQPRPWLAMTVAVPYLVTVVAMGYTRQGTAIGLAMIGLVALTNRRILYFVTFVALAATFHKSALILMPLAILAVTKNRLWTILWVGFASVVFSVLLLLDTIDVLRENYIVSEYQSSGAAVRIAMNSVPATLFLVFRKRFQLTPEQFSFWSWMSWSALFLLVVLLETPSSAAVDRIALYWIPLQLFVLSRLPNALGRRIGKNTLWVYTILAYSAAVHFVWLVYADNSFSWLPYQFYPWVWLENKL